MDRKKYLNNKMEQHRENMHKQFEEEKSKKYGQSEWLEEAYNREIARFQPIIDAINTTPNHTVKINGYTCKKRRDSYYFGVDEAGLSMIWIDEDSIQCLGKYFAIPIGSIKISENVNNRSFTTIGYSEMSPEDAQRTIFENANFYHYPNEKTDKKKQLDLQAQILMLKALGIDLTPNEESQILGITKEKVEKQVAEMKKEIEKEQEQSRSKRIQEMRRREMD